MASRIWTYWRQHWARGCGCSICPRTLRAPCANLSWRQTDAPLVESTHRRAQRPEPARKEGVTLFMTLLAALKILFARLSGQDDIVVGSTIAGRTRPELDGIIGFFINVLALRTDLSGDPSFAELLKRVREVCLDAYTHQDLPFERVVEGLNPQRDSGPQSDFSSAVQHGGDFRARVETCRLRNGQARPGHARREIRSGDPRAGSRRRHRAGIYL